MDFYLPKHLPQNISMKKYFAFFLAILFLSSFQLKRNPALKVISASRTQWSGGIAGRHGTSYNLLLRSSFKNKITLDSIWLTTEGCFDLKQEQNHSEFTLQMKTSSDKNFTTYEIIGGSFHDDNHRHYPDDFEKLQDISNPFRVKGEAVVSYYFNKKKHFLSVPSLTNYPAINYP